MLDILKDKLKVTVDPSEIQVKHMIPEMIGDARPVIVKLINYVKYRIMKVRKTLLKKD